MLKAFCKIGFLAATVAASPLPDPVSQTETGSSVSNPDEKMLFVFELVRHGARGPFDDRKLDLFTVGEGQLTPEGMRQRFLLGSYNRHRYVEQFNLIPPEFNEMDFFIQSTNVNRTLQSGYSELMGLYPPGSGTPLTVPQVQAVKNVARPPFSVRDAEALNHKLGTDPLPGRPVQVPIYSYNNNDVHDMVSNQGCPFITSVEKQRVNDPEVWKPYQWMIEQDRVPIEAMFGFSDDFVDSLNYNDFETFTDEATDLEFEGSEHPHETYFSDD